MKCNSACQDEEHTYKCYSTQANTISWVHLSQGKQANRLIIICRTCTVVKYWLLSYVSYCLISHVFNSFWACVGMALSVDPLLWSWLKNVFTTVGWIFMKYYLVIHGLQSIMPYDICDPQIFPIVPPSGRYLWFLVKCFDNYRMDSDEILSALIPDFFPLAPLWGQNLNFKYFAVRPNICRTNEIPISDSASLWLVLVRKWLQC